MPLYNTQIFENLTGSVKVVSGALVSVCAPSSSSTPVNPITTATSDANGNVVVSISSGTYDFFVTGAAISTYKFTQTVADTPGIVCVDGVIYAANATGIQAAINQAVSLGCREVWLPAGTINIATTLTITHGGFKLKGCGAGATDAGSSPATALVYTGSAGSDLLQISGTTPSPHIDKVILEDMILDGGSNARYTLRVQATDTCTFRDVRIRGGQTAGSYFVDTTGDNLYNVWHSSNPAYSMVCDWGSGQFQMFGGGFDQQVAMTGQQLLVQGASTGGQAFYGVTWQNDHATFVGAVKVTGFDTNSGFAGAPTGNAGAPYGVTFNNPNVTMTSSPSQGADFVIDGTVTHPVVSAAIINPVFAGGGATPIAILTDHSTALTILGGFSTGHTTATFSSTANTSRPKLIYLEDGGDAARITGFGSVVDIYSDVSAILKINALGGMQINGAAPTVGASQIGLGASVATSATAGSNGDVPAQVVGYLIINVAGTAMKVPYYNT